MSSAAVTYNFTNGLIADADQVDQNFSDLVNFSNSHLVHNHDNAVTRHGVRNTKGASSVNNTTATAITWSSSDDEDTDTYTSGAVNTITIPGGLGGMYAITFRSEALVTGRSFGQIIPTSGIANMPADFRVYMDPNEDRVVVSVVIPLLAGDTFQCVVFHSTGGAVSFASWLSCYRIGT